MRKRSPATLVLIHAVTIAFLSTAGAHSSPTDTIVEVVDEVIVTSRIDGSLLNLRITKPAEAGRMSLVLYIDGSLCLASTLPKVLQEAQSAPGPLGRFATLMVEKPGVSFDEDPRSEIRIDENHSCPRPFRTHYSLDQRVLDHLRALQHLRARAPWWNGELYVWGFSDGGAVGARVASYFGSTQRAALVGFGGGLPFTTLWEDYFLCADRKGAERTTCVEELRAQFTAMRGNPTTEKTWMGTSNTWKTWASRLDSVPARVLVDTTFPILIVHGAEDRSVPVDSARAAIRLLEQSSGPSVEYWEVPEMGHSSKSLDGLRKHELEVALLRWLLQKKQGNEKPAWVSEP